ncbi:ATP-binding protein [Trinickia caryophylli]|uniref:histidine kinase n=1 Tax=Trinickia caryophylli TaxID=28094 RepID=A0A1X7FVX5_TRICW|nr:ATP-binding protein [Trinickia caryophylli]PMS11814.1 HAMP domain-containing protein [Trinickia caryophylli]TRX17497.1 HAMP domain-containing protein [Trinickia caryophylli]WQE11757.1 ATP-binding protein [Trinickia caryophylli]SMF59645.1 two-component system, OmpR family, osmolarity sensor histidine kinase EnvZ [Trinickia caryophylli]GLU34745.1 two-component sensor histidine kinase [Trinickia caryophylli]
MRAKTINRIDTLFVRLSLMTIGLIVLVHLTSLWMVERERGRMDVQRMARELMLAAQLHDDERYSSLELAKTLGVRYVYASEPKIPGCAPPCSERSGPFGDDLMERLPAGSNVLIDTQANMLWVRIAHAQYWIEMPASLVAPGRFFGASAVMLLLAVAIAVVGAWRMQRPIRELARAAREFRLARRVQHVRLRGPLELKELIGDFNDMVVELERTERERSMMLAGVAHDLRAPITRMQVRADILTDTDHRLGFLRDTESLSRIVTQFLDYARESKEEATRVRVDDYCRQHYDSGDSDDPLIRLHLRAGDGFSLPGVDLDRLLSNLIENALTYGEPPVEISTSRHGDRYVLSVRDHGPGIPEAQMERALRPFVRLDAARGGDAHCGLGLAIVRRLARRNAGTLEASNAKGGGFCLALSFPIP